MSEAYLGNPNLKKINTKVEYTKEQILEYQKCASDPLYFMEKYVKIVSNMPTSMHPLCINSLPPSHRPDSHKRLEAVRVPLLGVPEKADLLMEVDSALAII